MYVHLYGYFIKNESDVDKLLNLNLNCKFYFFQLESTEILITFNLLNKIINYIPGIFKLNRNYETNTLFTINALNTLIYEMHKTINTNQEIEWHNYVNKLLILKSNNLIIHNLKLINV